MNGAIGDRVVAVTLLLGAPLAAQQIPLLPDSTGWGVHAGAGARPRRRDLGRHLRAPVPQAHVYGLVTPEPQETPFSFIETYGPKNHPDPVYQERFAISDVPPGEYVLGVEIEGARVYRRVRVEPGRLTCGVPTRREELVAAPEHDHARRTASCTLS